jgi:hypothetical protein
MKCLCSSIPKTAEANNGGDCVTPKYLETIRGFKFGEQYGRYRPRPQ